MAANLKINPTTGHLTHTVDGHLSICSCNCNAEYNVQFLEGTCAFSYLGSTVFTLPRSADCYWQYFRLDYPSPGMFINIGLIRSNGIYILAVQIDYNNADVCMVYFYHTFGPQPCPTGNYDDGSGGGGAHNKAIVTEV